MQSATEAISSGTRVPVMIILPEMNRIPAHSLPPLVRIPVRPAMDLLLRLLQILRPECRLIRSQWVIWSGSPLPGASTTGSLTVEI